MVARHRAERRGDQWDQKWKLAVRLGDLAVSGMGTGEAKPADEPDAWISPADLTIELAEWLARMEPFGEGNPMPVFGLRDVAFAEARPLGSEGKHLQVSFRDRQIPRAVWWNHGNLVEELRRDSFRRRDILFTVELSDYGERHVELRLAGILS